MSEDDVRALVERRAKPSWREWCRLNDVSISHLSEFMAGKRSPTTDLLGALGLEYRIVRRAAGRAALARSAENQ